MATDLNALRTAQGGTKTEAKKAPTLGDLLAAPGTKTRLASVASKLMDPQRMLALVANSISKTPKLGLCEPMSVIGAMMAAASLGLEPNTPQQQAFLIPYARRMKVGNQWQEVLECQFQIGARGLITLAYRSGRVLSLQAEAIHRGDLFKHMMGSETFLQYSKSLDDERGDLIGAFCFTKLKDEGESATVLPLSEILKIRDKSETFQALRAAVEQADNEKDRKKAQAKLDATPWVLWEDDMAAKSAIKKHSKRLPIQAGDLLYSGLLLDEAPTRALAEPDVLRQVLENGITPAVEGAGEADADGVVAGPTLALAHSEPLRVPPMAATASEPVMASAGAVAAAAAGELPMDWE